MIGIVVVSHSYALARAAVALAAEMVSDEARPAIGVAAGLDETTFGTDAMAIAETIGEADSPDGVLVLLDLGSAILSAEMALEFVDPEVAERVRLSPAPLVEGLVAAVVTASTGGSLDDADREARGGLEAKTEHLGGGVTEERPTPSGPGAATLDAHSLRSEHLVRNPHGLHARPAAALVSGLRGLDARVELTNATSQVGPVDGFSIGRVAGLGLRAGDKLVATFTGSDAAQAQRIFDELAASDFGETVEAESVSPEADGAPTGRDVVLAPALVRHDDVETSGYEARDPAHEEAVLKGGTASLDESLRQQGDALPAHKAIFEAQRAMAADPGLADTMADAVATGRSAVDAVHDSFSELADLLGGVDDPYLAERAQDVRSLERQLLRLLTGQVVEPLPQDPHVLVVPELDAATAAALDPEATVGVVTTTAGSTGHGLIIARARGVPVVTGREEAGHVISGTLVGLDAATGELWIDPDPDAVAEIRRRASR